MIALAFLLATAAPLPATPAQPIVIAHRGASGERPEHTLEAYRLAIAEGADFVEPDLVMTKDLHLVARHENEISGTTDIAGHAEFASRRTTKTIDGQSVTGWFTEDFTLAELKTLRARERLPQLRPEAAATYDGRYEIPTFAEILKLVAAESRRTGRRIGIYPEIKHSTYFAGQGLAMERPLLAALAGAGYRSASDPIFIQSFEVGNLRALHDLTKLRLIQLLGAEGAPADQPGIPYAAMLTPAGLKAIAAYAQGIGPEKALIVPRDGAGRSLPATTLVTEAHAAGLAVHPWTMRSENYFLPVELRRGASPAAHGDAAAEYHQFYALGVDGLFSEFPAEAVAARAAALAGSPSGRGTVTAP
jgi:glycerophosphoryl diester phosphodiesterase